MGRELNHLEVQELLGAYALDAVDGEDRDVVERHLDDCRRCRQEVAEHREVAAFMAAGWSPAPDGVWDRIAQSLEESPPAMRPIQLDVERERRRRRQPGPVRAVAAVGIAAAVALVGFLAVQIVDTGKQVEDVAQTLQPDLGRVAAAAAQRSDARTVSMKSSDGAVFADAVLLDDGSGYVVRTNLPALDQSRTYQLWAIVGTNAISVGVLGSSPGPAAFHTSGTVNALAITEETAGGVVASRQQPLVVGTVA